MVDHHKDDPHDRNGRREAQRGEHDGDIGHEWNTDFDDGYFGAFLTGRHHTQEIEQWVGDGVAQHRHHSSGEEGIKFCKDSADYRADHEIDGERNTQFFGEKAE